MTFTPFKRLLPALLALVAAGASAEIVFPNNPSVVDAKRDFGARGDGVTDDTLALQRAIDASCGSGGFTRALYIPNGTYRVSNTLVVPIAVGPWIYGQSRDGVVIRLVDNADPSVLSVLRTHPRDSGGGSADWFMRNVRNLTVHTGNNPNVDGIRFFANNTGILKNVRVTGNGNIGINAGFSDQSGPNIVQDVLVDGMRLGIQMQWSWGGTISRATVRNCRETGVYVSANAIGIEDLVVEDTPQPLFVDYPNDWTWWGGVVALVNARLTSGAAVNGPAIFNRSVLYARNVTSSGYTKVIRSDTPSGDVNAPSVREFTSHAPGGLFGSASSSLWLPVKQEPAEVWENDPSKWLWADDYGITAGDGTDDTAGFQAAFDAAAAQGKTVVAIRGARNQDPNWYFINGEVRVKSPVRLVTGVGWGRIIGTGRIVIDRNSAPTVFFRHIDAFGGTPVTLENRGAGTLVAESCGVSILGTGTGDIFLTNCPANIELQNPRQSLWARQHNPEGASERGLNVNRGARLWALGIKSEGRGVRYRTEAGGATELFGMFNYSTSVVPNDPWPMFTVEDSLFSVAGLREISFGSTYEIKVRERQRGVTREAVGGGWIGWSLFTNLRRLPQADRTTID